MTQKKRVLVTTSAKNGVPAHWVQFYDQVMRNPHPDYDFEFAVEDGNNALNLYRNIITQFAIERNFWKICQIDSDMLAKPEHLYRLVAHNEPFVFGLYCKKRGGDIKWLAIHSPNCLQPREDGLLECDFVGTGMFCAEIEALKTVCQKFPEREFFFEDEQGKKGTMFELFPIGLAGPNTPEGRLARIREIMSMNRDANEKVDRIDSVLGLIHPQKARLLGEDYHACLLFRKAGFKLYVDTRCVVGHVGNIVYPVEPDRLSKAAGIPGHDLSLDDFV